MKLYLSFFLILLVVVLAIITNPGEDTHKKLVERKIIEKIEAKEEKNARIFAVNPLSETMTSKMVEGSLSVSNYYIFSLTKLKVEEKQETIAVGAYGNLFFLKDVQEFVPNPSW